MAGAVAVDDAGVEAGVVALLAHALRRNLDLAHALFFAGEVFVAARFHQQRAFGGALVPPALSRVVGDEGVTPGGFAIATVKRVQVGLSGGGDVAAAFDTAAVGRGARPPLSRMTLMSSLCQAGEKSSSMATRGAGGGS